MRYGVIAIAVISVLLGSTAQRSHGDMIYGVGEFMDSDALSGVCSLDTSTSTARLLVHTPNLRWYGATDGPTPDSFLAIANPSYDPNPRSELYLINTTDWTVNSLGYVDSPGGGGPIREIGFDESTGTLYGTDYANLYTIPTAGGPATFVGTFGTDPNTGELVDYVFSLDYDPSAGSAGELVGTSWRRSADETDLYFFDRTNGAGTLVGNTGVDRLTDVLYSNDSSTLLGASRAPGRILNINSGTGAATQIGTTPDVSFFGLANATPGSPAPLPFLTAPLSNLGYETYAFASIETFIEITGAGQNLASPNPPPDDYGTNEAAEVLFDVQAVVPATDPWQNTSGEVEIDILGSDPSGLPEGMLRVSSSMTGTASGSDEGVGGVTRHSSVYGNANIRGAIGVGVPDGGTIGMSVLFGASVYTWGSGMDLLTWDLIIKAALPGGEGEGSAPGAAAPEVIFLDVDETSEFWTFTFAVPAGQILEYEFNYDGLLSELFEGDFELHADLDFGAAGQIPEPATMLVLCAGAIPIILNRRRRRS